MSILSKRLLLFTGSWSQRAIEYPWVLKHLPRRPNALVLDVGCSESLLSHELVAKGYQVIGIDIQEYPWKTHQMFFYQTNVLDTRFPPNLFDIIPVVSTIEHIGLNAYGQLALDQNGDLKAMAELRRILKSGGTLLLTTPYIGKGPIRITSTERQYDRDRLNMLVEGFEIAVEEFFYPFRVNKRLIWISLPKDKIDNLGFTEPGLACLVLNKL